MDKIDYNFGKLLPHVIVSAKNEAITEGFETKSISFVFEMFLNEAIYTVSHSRPGHGVKRTDFEKWEEAVDFYNSIDTHI